MKKITFAFTFLWITSTIFAQSEVTNHDHTSRQQVFFVELGGQGVFATINYDTRFTKSATGLGGRVGIGHLPFFGGFTTIPVSINYLKGDDGRYLEFGVGATFMAGTDLFSNDSFSGIVSTLTLGFRLQPEDGGFNFRVAATPFYGPEGVFPYGGISFGYTFP